MSVGFKDVTVTGTLAKRSVGRLVRVQAKWERVVMSKVANNKEDSDM